MFHAVITSSNKSLKSFSIPLSVFRGFVGVCLEMLPHSADFKRTFKRERYDARTHWVSSAGRFTHLSHYRLHSLPMNACINLCIFICYFLQLSLSALLPFLLFHPDFFPCDISSASAECALIRHSLCFFLPARRGGSHKPRPPFASPLCGCASCFRLQGSPVCPSASDVACLRDYCLKPGNIKIIFKR